MQAVHSQRIHSHSHADILHVYVSHSLTVLNVGLSCADAHWFIAHSFADRHHRGSFQLVRGLDDDAVVGGVHLSLGVGVAVPSFTDLGMVDG